MQVAFSLIKSRISWKRAYKSSGASKYVEFTQWVWKRLSDGSARVIEHSPLFLKPFFLFFLHFWGDFCVHLKNWAGLLLKWKKGLEITKMRDSNIIYRSFFTNISIFKYRAILVCNIVTFRRRKRGINRNGLRMGITTQSHKSNPCVFSF